MPNRHTDGPVGFMVPRVSYSDLVEFRTFMQSYGLGRSEPSTAHVLRREFGARHELAALRDSPVYAGEGVPDGEGQAILLFPGFLASQRCLTVMTTWLQRTGHRPEPYIGRDVGCGEAEVSRQEERLEALAERCGTRVAIIGHSRGGHLARALAVRRPDLVSGIVTLGTPSMAPGSAHRIVGTLLAGTVFLGALGASSCLRPSCFVGDCCRRYRTDVVAPMPDGVIYTQMLSTDDLVANGRTAADPAARQVAITTASHAGELFNAEVYSALAAALAEIRAAEASGAPNAAEPRAVTA
jgi:triacylglycerol lipase